MSLCATAADRRKPLWSLVGSVSTMYASDLISLSGRDGDRAFPSPGAEASLNMSARVSTEQRGKSRTRSLYQTRYGTVQQC